MKRITIVLSIILLSLTSQCIFAAEPNVLIIKNKNTGKENILVQGDPVELYCDCGGYSVKGLLNIVSDSSIAIDTDTFPIAIIEKIKIKPTTTRILGEITISVGVLCIVGGIIEGTQSQVFSDIPVGTYLTTGFALNATGIFLNWIRKSYSKEKWTYAIGKASAKKEVRKKQKKE